MMTDEQIDAWFGKLTLQEQIEYGIRGMDLLDDETSEVYRVIQKPWNYSHEAAAYYEASLAVDSIEAK